MLERHVEQHLVREVKKRGGLCFKWSSAQNRGVPDRVVLLDGVVHFIELKSPTGNLSPHQKQFIKNVEIYLNSHIKYATLYSKEEVDNYLKETEK